jgi:hypothetical protein
MKKQHNASAIINELQGNSAYFRQKPATSEEKPVSAAEAPEQATAPAIAEPAETKTEQSPAQVDEQPASQPVSQSTAKQANTATRRPTKRPVVQSVDQSTVQSIDASALVGRPKAFYISEKQDKDLNKAVELLSQELQGKINQKIDRSTIVRLVLERSQITKKESITQMASQLVSQLVSRLTG